MNKLLKKTTLSFLMLFPLSAFCKVDIAPVISQFNKTYKECDYKKDQSLNLAALDEIVSKKFRSSPEVKEEYLFDKSLFGQIITLTPYYEFGIGGGFEAMAKRCSFHYKEMVLSILKQESKSVTENFNKWGSCSRSHYSAGKEPLEIVDTVKSCLKKMKLYVDKAS